MTAASDPAVWPVRVAPLGPVALGSTLWRLGGRLNVTIAVKASFGFSLNDEMSCVAPLPVRRSDECARGVPSLRGASEIAPYLSQVDVYLHGHAYAPAGSVKSKVRLALEREGRMLLDKTLLVVGNRRRGKPGVLPFSRMRIGWEKALGGIGHPVNPIGVGADPDNDVLPNVVDPVDPNVVVGLGAVPSRFPDRRRRRGKVDQTFIEGGIADYPADFDWGFFQVAPPDQRLPALHGDEWLQLEGLHPDYPVIRTRLPSPRAYARVYSRVAVGAPDWVPLAVDTLHIEADDARCSIVWRGSFPLANELAAEELVVAGALELRQLVPSWPVTVDEAEALASPECRTAALRGGIDEDLQRTAESEIRRRTGAGQPAPVRVPPAPGSLPYDSSLSSRGQAERGAAPIEPGPVAQRVPAVGSHAVGAPPATLAGWPPAKPSPPAGPPAAEGNVDDWSQTILVGSLEQAMADPNDRNRKK